MKFNIKHVKFSYRDLKEGRCLPLEPSAELAEILGVLAGDGHVAHHVKNHDYLIEIAGHAKDDLDYLDYLKRLMHHTFNLEMKLRVVGQINTAYLSKRSQAIVLFFDLIGFKKKNCMIEVPEWIWMNKVWAISFVRGLFDTDGSVALKRNHGKSKYYPVVSITLKDADLVERIASFLHSENFKVTTNDETRFDKRTMKTYGRRRLQVSGYTNVGYWFTIIGSSHPKHKEKMGRMGFEFMKHKKSCTLP